MIVRMWMSKPVIVVSSQACVTEAALLMGKHHIRRVVVADPHSDGGVRVKGILSKHDVLHAYPPHINPFLQVPEETENLPRVSQIMTHNVLSIHPDAPVEEAAIVLRDKKIGALPVMLDQQLIGIITESDIFKALTRLLMGSEETIRITLEVGDENVLPAVTQKAKQMRVYITSIATFVWKKRRAAILRVSGGRERAFVQWLWESGIAVLDISPSLEAQDHEEKSV